MSSRRTVISISPSGKYSFVAKEPKYSTLAVGYFSTIMVLTLKYDGNLHFENGKASLVLSLWGADVFVELDYLVVETQKHVLHLSCRSGQPWVGFFELCLLQFLDVFGVDRLCLQRDFGGVEANNYRLLRGLFIELDFLCRLGLAMTRKWLLLMAAFTNRLFHQRRRKPLLLLFRIHCILKPNLHYLQFLHHQSAAFPLLDCSARYCPKWLRRPIVTWGCWESFPIATCVV